jgi:hypothetical protein
MLKEINCAVVGLLKDWILHDIVKVTYWANVYVEKVKGKVVSFHAMKTYNRSRGIDLLILYLGK